MDSAVEARRRSLLSSLYFAPGSTMGIHKLQRELQTTHNTAASADQVRGDLSWLKEQGFVLLLGDVAQLTERGRDVALQVAPWPGQ